MKQRGDRVLIACTWALIISSLGLGLWYVLLRIRASSGERSYEARELLHKEIAQREQTVRSKLTTEHAAVERADADLLRSPIPASRASGFDPNDRRFNENPEFQALRARLTRFNMQLRYGPYLHELATQRPDINIAKLNDLLCERKYIGDDVNATRETTADKKVYWQEVKQRAQVDVNARIRALLGDDWANKLSTYDATLVYRQSLFSSALGGRLDAVGEGLSAEQSNLIMEALVEHHAEVNVPVGGRIPPDVLTNAQAYLSPQQYVELANVVQEFNAAGDTSGKRHRGPN